VRQISRARVPRHEVDRLRRDEVGGDDDIAFVFAILLVDQDDHAAGLQFSDDFERGNEGHGVRIGSAGRRRSTC
jgi:hypothetical protein